MLAEVFEKLKWILIQFYGSSDYILDIGILSLQIEAFNVFFFSNQARAPCFSIAKRILLKFSVLSNAVFKHTLPNWGLFASFYIFPTLLTLPTTDFTLWNGKCDHFLFSNNFLASQEHFCWLNLTKEKSSHNFRLYGIKFSRFRGKNH